MNWLKQWLQRNRTQPPGVRPGGPKAAAPMNMPPRRTWLTFLIVILINYFLMRLLFPGPDAPIAVPYTFFKEQVAKAIAWAKLIKKYKGRVFTLGPNQVDRSNFDFSSHKENIVSTLNEVSKAVSDQGITPVLHQHTGTCVETRDETYATLDAIDTRYLKFGPDVGQLTKGGADALKVVKDYLPLVQHMHLKDFDGKDEHLLGYCPLGKGKVDVPAILDLMTGRKISGMVMVELDNDPKDISPVPPKNLAAESQVYLKSIGVRFRV